jgi:hypothetical protein
VLFGWERNEQINDWIFAQTPGAVKLPVITTEKLPQTALNNQMFCSSVQLNRLLSSYFFKRNMSVLVGLVDLLAMPNKSSNII